MSSCLHASFEKRLYSNRTYRVLVIAGVALAGMLPVFNVTAPKITVTARDSTGNGPTNATMTNQPYGLNDGRSYKK